MPNSLHLTDASDHSSARDVESLRADSLRSLAVVFSAMAYLWMAYLVLVRHDTDGMAWGISISLAIICLKALWLLSRRESLACILFSIEATILTLYVIGRTADIRTPFTIVLPILTAGVVVSRRWQIAITFTACAVMGIVGWLRADTAMPTFGAAIFVALTTALISWLITRNLYVAVDWATFSHRQAQQSVAELRERRAHLRQLADTLHNNQERMHYLNLRLEQTKVAAEEAYRTKQHFVANVSHELRTPLNLITGFSEMMCFSPESYGGVRLPPQYREDVMEIYRSSKHLLSLVEDVLALAQLEAGQMIVQREWADLAEVVRDATDAIRPLIEAKGLALEVHAVSDLPQAFIDSGRIRQVLLNLLNNAYRFTEQGQITVAVDRHDDTLTIAVADTGVGIAEEDLPRIFEEFHNLSGGPSARRTGFGLGLSISRRLVEAHGGSLVVNSRRGAGSCFTVSLPVADGSEVARRPSLVHTGPRTEVDRTKPVVLVVGEEDNAHNLDRHLGRYQVVYVRPDQAVAACEQYLPVAVWVDDVPVLDQERSHVDELLRGWPQLPVVTCHLPSRAEMARSLGVDGFFGKPIVREQMAETIARLSNARPINSILIIDDDPQMVHLLQRMLASTQGPSCHIIEACGGQEGLDIMAQERPDLVLLDLSMPEVNGYDVLDAMRARPKLRDTRVVLMSGVGIGEEDTPVGALSVQCQAGFSLQRALGVTAALIEQLSPRVG